MRQPGADHLSAPARWTPGKNSRNQRLDSKPSPDQTFWHPPEEIAAGVLYLTSPESAFVSGAELIIDGGIATL